MPNAALHWTPVARSVAYLIIPSARFTGHGGPHAKTGLAGHFTYEPPPGVAWTD